MLQQILMKTPVWVWALLAFLVYRGLASSIDREVRLKKLFIIPVVVLVLSLHGLATGFGASAIAAPVWLASMAVGTVLAWTMFNTGNVAARPERNAVALRGNWTPLVLMMAIFCTKYIVGVALSMQPALAQDSAFVVVVCVLYGLFNGVFIGQLLRIVAIYREGIATSYKLL